MPITSSVPIKQFDQPSFHAVDEVVTGIAFDVHNEFGRYLDECLYQTELNERFAAREFNSVREMKITLSLDDFAKDYFVDFLIDAGVILETKTVEALTSAHRAQVLNYLFLCDLHHATLLNFRTERVQHEFVSTQLTATDRRAVRFEKQFWRTLSDQCRMLETTLARALQDWGSCLDPILYREVVTHFLGGESKVVGKIPIYSRGAPIGKQKVHLLTDDIAFSITASVHHAEAVLEHHRRFLQHTPLRAIQWINLNRLTITLHTISR